MPETAAVVTDQTQNHLMAAPVPGAPANTAHALDKPPIPQTKQPTANATPVKIETDLFIAEINPVGAVLQRLTLRHYADGLRNPKTGKCEGVSSAIRIAAIPAFVTDLPNATRTAAR